MIKKILITSIILFSPFVMAKGELSYSNGWKAGASENDFTGRKICYIYSNYKSSNYEEDFNRTIMLSINGNFLSKKGNIIEKNYHISAGALTGSSIQAIVDGTSIDIENGAPSSYLRKLKAGNVFKFRYDIKNNYMDLTETPSISLSGFTKAHAEAVERCK